MLVPTQTVWLQLMVLQQTFTWTVTTQMAVKTQVLPPPRPASSLPSSEGEERLWRARTSTSKSLSNMYMSPHFRDWVGYSLMLVPTQTVWLQLMVLQQTFTWTVRPQIAVKTQVLPPPRPPSSLPSSEGEVRLWRARTSTSNSLSNMCRSLPFGVGWVTA